jgi:hypothetical protein
MGKSSPSWILKNIPQNGMRRVTVMISHSDIRSPDFILLRDFPDPIDEFMFVYKNKSLHHFIPQKTFESK